MRERKNYPSFQADQFNVRFPAGVRDRIAATAKENGRSMNAEIVARLERSFAEDGNLKSGALDLNGLLSAGMLLAAEENKDDPATQALIARAKEAALRLARITYSAESETAAVDAKK